MISRTYLVHKTKNVNISADLNTTSEMLPNGLAPNRPSDLPPSKSVLTYILVPLGSLIAFAIIAVIVIFFLRRTRMERLRHRLMPLYSYDPEEDNADWEAELIEDDREQQRALTAIDAGVNLPQTEPRLSFLRSPPDA